MFLSLSRPQACGLLACAWLSATAAPAAEDPLPAATVRDVNAASVLVKIHAGPVTATGTGFVVRADADTLYVATNRHVVEDAIPSGGSADPDGPKCRVTPNPRIEVVFDSGRPGERTATAELAAADEEFDLAVLRVRGVANPPRPIDMAAPGEVAADSPVWVFGFRSEDVFSPGGGPPPVRSDPANVTAVRRDRSGAAASVQLNRPVNPGKSGGPVVSRDGKLVGMTAGPGWGSRPGYAVPHHRMYQTFGGRVGGTRVREAPCPGGVGAWVTADLADPFRRIKPGTERVYVLPADDWWDCPVAPAGGTWPPLPGAARLKLTPAPHRLTGSAFTPVRGRPSAVWTQTEWERDDGTLVRGQPVKHPWPGPRTTLPTWATVPVSTTVPPDPPAAAEESLPTPEPPAPTPEPPPPAAAEGPVSVGPLVGAAAAVFGVALLVIGAMVMLLHARRAALR